MTSHDPDAAATSVPPVHTAEPGATAGDEETTAVPAPDDGTTGDGTTGDGTTGPASGTFGPRSWRSRLDRPAKRWETAVYSVLAVSLALAAVWGIQPSGRAALRPGAGIDVSALVEGRVEDPGFPRAEHVMGLTVQLDPLSRAGWLVARLRGEEILETDSVSGSVHQLDVSRSAAVAAAWELATGEELTTIAVVSSVLAGSPAEDAGLEPGDRILLADDRDVRTATMLSAIVRNAGPGTTVRLLVERGERRMTVPVDVGADSRIGVAVVDTLAEQPLDVHVAGVAGGSAGLAFALAFVDALGDGDLLAGRSVAATGTIDADGSVGEIGGLAVKLRSAPAKAASMVLVPSSQLTELGSKGRDPSVVGVDTLVDAVRVLCDAGATDEVCTRLGTDEKR